MKLINMYIWPHLHSNQNWECQLTFVLKSFKKVKARFKIQSKKLFMKIKALENHVISRGIIIKYKAACCVLNYCNHLGRIICFKTNLQMPFSFLMGDSCRLPLLQQIWFFPPTWFMFKMYFRSHLSQFSITAYWSSP